ncbi:SDR family NAD(P)-dependent oxidoreductase [Streptomyces sp. NPDC001966]
MSPLTLHGKSAIVTGGASGIGGAITKLFVARGARVVVVDLQQDAGETLARELGNSVVFLRGDVSDRAVADQAVAAAAEHYGKLDVLVNNASASRQKPFEEQTDDDWNLAMDTSLYATRNFMLAALPELKKTGNASITNQGVAVLGAGAPSGPVRSACRNRRRAHGALRHALSPRGRSGHVLALCFVSARRRTAHVPGISTLAQAQPCLHHQGGAARAFCLHDRHL